MMELIIDQVGKKFIIIMGTKTHVVLEKQIKQEENT